MEAYFPRKALAAQKGLHTCCFNCLQYQGFPIECKCWVQKTLTCQPFLPALRTQSGCNTCFVLLRMLYGTYSSAKLKIISAAAFQIIGLGKLSRNEFLLLGWIYCSIRIMMGIILYFDKTITGDAMRAFAESRKLHVTKLSEFCKDNRFTSFWQCVRLLSTYMHANEDKLRQQKQFKSPVRSIYINYSTACRHCKYS